MRQNGNIPYHNDWNIPQKSYQLKIKKSTLTVVVEKFFGWALPWTLCVTWFERQSGQECWEQWIVGKRENQSFCHRLKSVATIGLKPPIKKRLWNTRSLFVKILKNYEVFFKYILHIAIIRNIYVNANMLQKNFCCIYLCDALSIYLSQCISTLAFN